MPHDPRYNDFWAFLGKGTCICKHRRSLHCERWAVDSPCSQLRHWSESPSASLTVVRRAGCRGPCIYLSVDKHDAVRPQPPTRRWSARRVQRALYLLVHGQVTQFSPNLPLACGSQGAEGPVSTCPKTNDAVLPQPPTHLDLYFYGTRHLIHPRTHAPAHPPTRAPAPALAPPPGAFARRHTHTGARPPYVLAPAVLPRTHTRARTRAPR